jgi:ribosomal-protein-alanine N-acetyltransferase
VRPSNAPARALYEAFGFEVVGRRRGYYADTGEDAILLARDLAAVE